MEPFAASRILFRGLTLHSVYQDDKHDDGKNYCFRLCADKPECNLYRSPDTEANCTSKVDYVAADKDTTGKACVPPSSGI